MEIEPERAEMNTLVRGAVEEYQHVAQASRLELAFEGSPAPAHADADRRRIQQVMTNLLSNAIKFTAPGGRVAVRVRADDRSVEVSVQDTGRGISETALPSLFQRYVRGPDAVRDIAGTGLGLLIVREIVEAHGGRVAVESQVGRGSTFTFTLARKPASALAAG